MPLSDEEITRLFNEPPFCHIPLENALAAESTLTELRRLIVEYRQIIMKNGPVVVRGFEARVDVKPGSTPVQARIFNHGPIKEALLREWAEKYEQQNLIEPSTAPWRAGCLVIPKNNGCEGLDGVRVVQDFRLVNKEIKNVSWVLPNVQDLLDDTAGSRFISTMDLKSAYHQIPIHRKEDRAVLTFCCQAGCYAFRVMPMGLKTASAYFQRFVDMALGDLKYRHSPGGGKKRRRQMVGGRDRSSGSVCQSVRG